MSPSSQARSAGKAWIVRLAILVAVLAVFGRVVGQGILAWDDQANTLGNPHLVPPSASGLLYLWRHAYADLYVPLTFTLWGLLSAVSTSAWIYHAVSLVLHGLAALAAFGLLRRLVRDDVAAGAGALLFALHPVQAESVAWMSGAKDVMCGMFSLLALSAHVDVARAEPGSAGRQRARARGTALVVLALLSKPSAMALPLLALVLDLGWIGRRWTRALLDLAPWIAVAVVGAFIARSVQSAAEVVPTSIGSRPFVAADAIAFYARKIAAPLSLAPDYGRDPKRVLADALPIATALAVVVAIGAIAILRRRERDASGPFHATAAASALSIAAVSPVLGLVPFDFQRYSTVADHYLYVAMIGPALLLAWLVAQRPAILLRIVVGILLLLCAGKSFAQAGVWKDDETLWRHTLAVNPKSWVAHGNLGDVHMREGRIDLAMEEYREALAIRPEYAQAYCNIGMGLELSGKPAEALAEYATALRLDPGLAEARVNHGRLLLKYGRVDDAIAELEAALRSSPEFVEAHQNLGVALLAKGRNSEALAEFRRALELRPGYAEAQRMIVKAGGAR